MVASMLLRIALSKLEKFRVGVINLDMDRQDRDISIFWFDTRVTVVDQVTHLAVMRDSI